MPGEDKRRRQLAGCPWAELNSTRIALASNATQVTIAIPLEATHIRMANNSSSSLNYRWDGQNATSSLGIRQNSNTIETVPIPANAVDLRVCTAVTDAAAILNYHFLALYLSGK